MNNLDSILQQLITSNLPEKRIREDLLAFLQEDFDYINETSIQLVLETKENDKESFKIDTRDNFYLVNLNLQSNPFDRGICNAQFTCIFIDKEINNYSEFEKMYCDEDIPYFKLDYQFRDNNEIILIDYDIFLDLWGK